MQGDAQLHMDILHMAAKHVLDHPSSHEVHHVDLI
jgi:hypothetical protein